MTGGKTTDNHVCGRNDRETKRGKSTKNEQQKYEQNTNKNKVKSVKKEER